IIMKGSFSGNFFSKIITNMNNQFVPVISATEVAKLLLSYDPEREYFCEEKIISLEEDGTEPTQGNFRINKMLHICQMLHYAKYDQPLFKEELRAYARGAIVYPIYKN